MRLLGTTLLLAMASPLVAAPSPAATSGRWTVEKSPDKVILRLRSDPPAPPLYRDSVAFVIACDVPAKTLHVRFSSRSKTAGQFVVRFDGDPAITYGKPTDRFYDPEEAHRLEVEDEEATAFVARVRGSRRILLRFEHLGRYTEVTFDPSGLATVIRPLQQACSLPEAAAPTKALAAAAKTPRESVSGRWDIRETFSTIDDQPVVVARNQDRPPTATLVLRCQEKTIEAFFALNTGLFDANEKTGLVRFAIGYDGREAVAHDGPTTAGFAKAVFLPEPAPFLKALPTHRSLTFTYTAYRKTAPTSTTFDLGGVEGALRPLLAACPSP